MAFPPKKAAAKKGKPGKKGSSKKAAVKARPPKPSPIHQAMGAVPPSMPPYSGGQPGC